VNLAAAIFDVMKADQTLADQLGRYNEAPCIFTSDIAPELAPRPYILTGGNVSDEPVDTKNSLARRVHRDIRIYDDSNQGGSTVRIDAIAERVRALFHRVNIPVTGFATIYCTAHGPIAAPTDETLYGRVITIELHLSEND
jgi:hypothetical protein